MAISFGRSNEEDVVSLIAAKKYARAIEVLKARLQKRGANPSLRMQLADVLILADKKQEAVALLLPLADQYARDGFAAKAVSVLKKVQKARDIKGPRFLHVLAPCPPGWRFPPEKMVALGRLATDSNVFPLYEIEGGKYRITRKLGTPKPIAEYLKLQGRFAHMTPEEVAASQAGVDARWKRLLALEALG